MAVGNKISVLRTEPHLAKREDVAALQSKPSSVVWLVSCIKKFIPGRPCQQREANHVVDKRRRKRTF